jgi:hypothetical protein
MEKGRIVKACVVTCVSSRLRRVGKARRRTSHSQGILYKIRFALHEESKLGQWRLLVWVIAEADDFGIFIRGIRAIRG